MTDESDATGASREIRRAVVIANMRGLHARAAARFVKLAQSFDADIHVVRGDNQVSGRSILGLMTLAAGIGTVIEIRSRGADAAPALAALADMVERKFDEE